VPRSKFHLTAAQLAAIENTITHSACPRVRRRAEAITLVHDGHTPAQVAQTLGVTVETVRRWLRRYRRDGVDGLADRPRSGRPSKADQAYHDTLEAILAETPYDMGVEDASGWTVTLLRQWMEQDTGISLSDRRMRVLLHTLGYRYQQVPSLLSELMPPFPKNLEAAREWLALEDAMRETLPVSQQKPAFTWLKVDEKEAV
jgi:transposase